MSQSKLLFEKFGYQKTTLTDIAKSAGYVKSAIYYYFSGKEEIFATLVKYEAEDFLKRLTSEVNKETTPTAQLKSYVNTRIDLMEDVAKRFEFLKTEFFELMPIVEENRREFDIQEVAFLTRIIEKLNTDEGLNIENPPFTSKLLMQMIKGMEVQMFVTDEMSSHNEDRDAFVKFILYGILK